MYLGGNKDGPGRQIILIGGRFYFILDSTDNENGPTLVGISMDGLDLD